ncbi:MAG: excinuclease ABC subunit UvrC [Clostridia bacterium]|jgi:excinuclease ABC subunit C|nr:excinuclease ABC subunit UvrC [Clostridia bacterium]
MNEIIRDKLKTLTTKPGVYVMRDCDGVVIYVGKAKNLKNRVSQYFRNSPKPSKVQAMVDNVASFDYFITMSEMDALALESNLIKKYQPFYNILLKDGKQFPYIKIDLKDPFPRFEIVRKVKKDGAKYFGPYFAGLDAREILKTINAAFKIRTCSNKITETSIAKRECLNYSLGLCLAPCTKQVSRLQYLNEIEKAVHFLNGNDNEIEEILQKKMLEASENENFENAIILRERLKMVKKLKDRIVANLPKDVSKDVFAYVTDGLSGVITYMVVRGGKILGIISYPCMDAELEEGQTLFNFISQYYQNMIVPNEIILSHEINSPELLSEFLGKKINFITNPHGINKNLLDMAKENAKEYLEKHIEKDRLKYNNTLGALKVLQEKLNLKELPLRMECYDISNISGTNKVCSMVVFKNGEPSKKDYRKFKIKTVKGSNDFASLEEALTRRLKRFKEQNGESFKEKPNLLVIDGGKGQLSSCFEILTKMNLQDDIQMISLAKRIEEVFHPNNSLPTLLKPGSAELKLLQRIRDEAHRFAITFHRDIRLKKQTKSVLDEIEGIGPKKRDALLKAFGTSENIAKLDIEMLTTLPEISPALAANIHKYFKTHPIDNSPEE